MQRRSSARQVFSCSALWWRDKCIHASEHALQLTHAIPILYHCPLGHRKNVMSPNEFWPRNLLLKGFTIYNLTKRNGFNVTQLEDAWRIYLGKMFYIFTPDEDCEWWSEFMVDVYILIQRIFFNKFHKNIWKKWKIGEFHEKSINLSFIVIVMKWFYILIII